MIDQSFPLISVIIPVYNGESMLKAALDSVLAQNYPNLQIIIVDDGSTDGSKKIVEQFSMVQYHYQSNKGPAAARNKGIQLSKGEFIAFLDADDLFPKNKLFHQLSLMNKNPKVKVVRGLVKWVYLTEEKKYIPNYFYDEVEKTHFNVNLGALLIRKEVIDLVGDLDESFKHSEDTDFWNRILVEEIETLDHYEVGLIYQIHAKNMTADNEARGKGLIKAFLKNKERINQKKSASKRIGLRKLNYNSIDSAL